MSDERRPVGGGTKQAVALPRWALAAVPVAVVALVAVAFFAGRSAGSGSANRGPDGQYVRPAVGEDGRIGYATQGVVATDPETLQDQVDKMYEQAKQPGVALQYKNMMVSEDGQNFTCFIGNSADNAYDMFITIYADQALTDELFLSELIRPGERFEQVTFSRKLDPGDYTGYVVYTQVDDEKQADDTFIQVVHAQVATTIDIKVNG